MGGMGMDNGLGGMGHGGGHGGVPGPHGVGMPPNEAFEGIPEQNKPHFEHEHKTRPELSQNEPNAAAPKRERRHRGVQGAGEEASTKKAHDTIHELEVTLEELFTGTTKTLNITRTRLVKSNEEGHVSRTRTEEKLLKIDIKKGWKDGTKLTFEGEGDEGVDVAAGSIVVFIRERAHSKFKRSGKDLYLMVDVPLREALCGGAVDVATIDDRLLQIKYDGVMQPGATRVFVGEGMPIAKSPKERGNLIITFEVLLPSELSKEQRSVLWATLGE